MLDFLANTKVTVRPKVNVAMLYACALRRAACGEAFEYGNDPGAYASSVEHSSVSAF